MNTVRKVAVRLMGAGILFGIGVSPADASDWNWTGFIEGNAYSRSGGDKTKTDLDTGESETEPGRHIFGAVADDFQLSHAHLKLNTDFSEGYSGELGLCLSHHEGLSVKEAFLNANLWEADGFGDNISAVVGRFSVPFGQFNQRSEVGGFETISRPLLFPSHDIDYLQPSGNHAIPMFMSQYTDIGAQLNGTFYLAGEHQLWLGAYVVNGLYDTETGHAGGTHTHGPSEADDHGEEEAEGNQISWLQEERFASDNNGDKALGARAALSLGEGLVIGASYTSGDYDSEETLSYEMYGADVAVVAGQLTVRGEYASRKHDVVGVLAHGDGELLMDEVDTDGFYLQAILSVSEKLALILGYDEVVRNGIVESGHHPGEYRNVSHSTPGDIGTQRMLAGATYQINPYVALKFEYTRWMFDDVIEGNLTAAPDRIEFDDVDRFSAGLAMVF